MPHLYDIDSDNTPIKHAQFKHDSVQDAMAVAQSETTGDIQWSVDSPLITNGYVFDDNDFILIYQIVE